MKLFYYITAKSNVSIIGENKYLTILKKSPAETEPTGSLFDCGNGATVENCVYKNFTVYDYILPILGWYNKFLLV